MPPSTKTEAPTATPAAALPPHIKAKFVGTYYKATGTGKEYEPFEFEVPVPISWLDSEDYTPIGVFQAFYAPRLLASKPGYSGVRFCELAEAGELPNHLTDNNYLNWTADYAELLKFINTRRLPVQFGLYPSCGELRKAIKRALTEPEAFKKEQEARSHGRRALKRNMEADLQALGL